MHPSHGPPESLSPLPTCPLWFSHVLVGSFSGIASRLRARARTKYELPDGAEALRWFHFPLEPTGTMSTAAVIASMGPSNPGGSRAQAKQCLVSPRVYDREKARENPKTLRRSRSVEEKKSSVVST